MSTLSGKEKTEIETDVKNIVETDLLSSLQDGKLATDVFNKLNDPANNYYMDCAPVGHSADEITTYNVPINSEYTRDSARLDIYKTLVGLCFVIIFMILTYFTVPFFYKYGIIDVINRMFEGNSSEKNTERLKRLTSIDFWFSTWYLGITTWVFLLSFSQGLWAIYLFVVLLMIYILSVVVIDGKKKDDSFMTTLLPHGKQINTQYIISENNKIDYLKYVDPMDIFNCMVESIVYMSGWNDIHNKRPNITAIDKMPQVAFICFGILTFYYVGIIVAHYGFDYFTDDQFKTYTWTFPIFLLLPCVLYFCLLFDVGTEYRRNHGKNLVRKLVNVNKNVEK
jgi:hypothetical protein